MNGFKQAIGAGRRQIGLWQALASPYTAVICAGAGFDTILTGLIGGLASQFIARLVVGRGEGPAFPAATQAMRNWYHAHRFGYIQRITHGASRLGAAIAPPLVATIISGGFYFQDDPRIQGALGRQAMLRQSNDGQSASCNGRSAAKHPELAREKSLARVMQRHRERFYMHFKIVPAIGRRYWVSIAIASICGANMGDFIPDVLKLSDLGGLLMLALIFAIIALANKWSRRGNEALYWLAILVIRAAATNLADLAIGRAHLSYITVSASLAALLLAILAFRRASSAQPATQGLPRTNGLYWLTMLTAGALGTVLGDGVAHTIHPITVGVPVSAVIATAAVARILGHRTNLNVASAEAPAYWAAIVAIRIWGTNVGDIAAFFLSLPVSMMLSGLLLAVTLMAWRESRTPALPAATY